MGRQDEQGGYVRSQARQPSVGHDGWVLIELMGNDEPSILFEGSRWKPFSRLDRRSRVHPSVSMTNQLRAIADRVRHSDHLQGGLIVEQWSSGATDERGYLVAEPIFGPPADPRLYAVLVWIGSGAPPECARTVGTMMWDPRNILTYHSEVTETRILGNDPPVYERTSPEVFKHFRDYPKEHALGPWVASVQDGSVSEEETFHDTIEIERTDGELLNVHLAMKAVETPQGWLIRGVVHDISDMEAPTGQQGYSRRTARAFASVLDDAAVEIGALATVNFATGIILEWLTPPPPPIDEWRNTNGTWGDFERVSSHIKLVADGGASVSKFSNTVTFPDSPRPIPIAVTVYPATQGQGLAGAGIMRIEEG